MRRLRSLIVEYSRAQSTESAESLPQGLERLLVLGGEGEAQLDEVPS